MRYASHVLFCGDLFSCMGSYPPTTTDDIVGPASKAEDEFPSMSLHPASGSVIRDLARFDDAALALMHGPVFTGDCGAALHALPDDTDLRIQRAGTA